MLIIMSAERLIVNTIVRPQYITAILLITYSGPWKVINIKREFYKVMLVGLKNFVHHHHTVYYFFVLLEN